MNNLTREWLDVFHESKAAGENLADSVFWRLAPDVLPEGVDGDNPEVKSAVAEIVAAVKVRESRR